LAAEVIDPRQNEIKKAIIKCMDTIEDFRT
jgi:hypothetical protein